MKPKDTKQRILDAAEQLFAGNGYHCTSLRAITKKAKANVASVNYYFGSKEALITAVIERRLLPLNAIRLKRLQEVHEAAAKKGARPETRALLNAFIDPTLHFRESSDGSKSFVALVGRIITEPDDTVRSIFLRLIKPVFKVLFEMTSESLPHIPISVLRWRIQFMIGALSHTMYVAGKTPFSADHEGKSPDAASLVNMLLPFVTAGMEAPL